MKLAANNFPTDTSPLKTIENRLDSRRLFYLSSLRRLAAAHSLPLYLVGGVVRDLLLGLPIKDLDLMVEGDATVLARSLAAEAGGKVKVINHLRFGTATVELDQGRIDLASSRREVYPQPGALPEVVYASARDDAGRRDFSINAMALPLNRPCPQLLDFYNGLDDLREGLIRTLHPLSFVDDPTRLLRALRYEQRLGFALAPDTALQLDFAVAQGCLDTVSADRLRRELDLILGEERPDRVLIRGISQGVLPGIMPALNNSDYLHRWAAFLYPEGKPPTNSAALTFSVVSPTPPTSPVATVESGPLTWLAVLAYPLSVGEGDSLVRRLNMPKAWARIIADTILLKSWEQSIARWALKPAQLCERLDRISPAALTVVAVLTDSAPARRWLNRYLGELRDVEPTLSGRDLAALGVPAGPLLGQMLAELRAERIDGRVAAGAAEIEWVRRRLAALTDERV